MARGQLGRVLRAVAGHLELLGPPGLDQLDVSSLISVSAAVLTSSYSDATGRPVLPLDG